MPLSQGRAKKPKKKAPATKKSTVVNKGQTKIDSLCASPFLALNFFPASFLPALHRREKKLRDSKTELALNPASVRRLSSTQCAALLDSAMFHILKLEASTMLAPVCNADESKRRRPGTSLSAKRVSQIRHRKALAQSWLTRSLPCCWDPVSLISHRSSKPLKLCPLSLNTLNK